MSTPFNGLGMSLGNLPRLSRAKSRSISSENKTGEKGKGGMAEPPEGHASSDLGQGWKCRPCEHLEAGETLELTAIDGPGALQQIWMTPAANWRFLILRMYWDGQEQPSVEVPVGDFFASAWARKAGFAQLASLAVCCNPGSAFNCYWEMPFRKHCRITMENIGRERATLFYQINYTLTEVPDDAAYFHAQFRRVNPLPFREVHTILDGVGGPGHYVGTYLAWGVNNDGWWGEGEIKFYLDGDGAFPTICGTGTEDYFCGSYNFEVGTPATGALPQAPGAVEGRRYQEFCTPYAGMPQVVRPDGLYRSQQRFSLYRWHIMDPVRFEQDLRVTIQALGWRDGGRYLPLRDDIASVAYWYQALPTAPFPPLPQREALEII
jgi:hypothetical protein